MSGAGAPLTPPARTVAKLAATTGRVPANTKAAPDTQICMETRWITIKPPTAPNGYASSHDCRVNCSLRSADRRGRRSRSRGVQRLGRATDRRPLRGGKLAGGSAQFAQTWQDSASGIVDACGPGSPDSHRVVWGLTSRPPVPPAGLPPVSRLPAGFSPFARLPLVSLRPAFSGSSPSAVARFRFPFGVPPGSVPLSNLHDSAAAGRFRRRWSRAARAKVTSPAATPRLDLAVIRPALQMGSGWARWDAATESPPLTQAAICPAPPRWSRRKRHV